MTKNTINLASEMNKATWLNWGMRALFAALAIFILWKSLEPFYGQPGSHYIDKVQHFMAYFILSGFALLSRSPLRPLRLLLAILVFSAMIEILQGAMNMGRTASFADFVANLAGILAAWACWRVVQSFKKNMKKNP